MKTSIFWVSLSLSPFSMLAAQRISPPIVDGMRIRVTTPELQPARYVGTFAGWSPDSTQVLVERRADTVSLATHQIQRIESSRGKKRQWLLGSLVGVAVGVGVASLANVSEEGPFAIAKEDIVLGSGVLGALVGGLAGVFIRRERWRELPLNAPNREEAGRSP